MADRRAGPWARLRVVAPLLVRAFPPTHGGARVMLGMLAGLARRGARVEAVLRMQSSGAQPDRFEGQHPDDLTREGIRARRGARGEVRFRWHGVALTGVEGDAATFSAVYRDRAAGADAQLLSDQGVVEFADLLAWSASQGTLVYAAQTVELQPFGPHAAAPDLELTRCLRDARLVVAPSRFLARYTAQHLGVPACVHMPAVFKRPWTRGGPGPYVGMINPCVWKGASVFGAIARALPGVRFAAVPTWGAVPDALDDLPNLTFLPECSDIDDVLRHFRVLLMPSLWHEAFGLVAVEAMLRGIPVIASDLGGLPESTLGVGTLVPVAPVSMTCDADGVVRTTVPTNPPEPWLDALCPLLDDADAWRAASVRARAAAERFVAARRHDDLAQTLRRALRR